MPSAAPLDFASIRETMLHDYNARMPSSRIKAMEAAYTRFLEFCEDLKVDPDLTSDNLACYASFRCRQIKVDSVKSEIDNIVAHNHSPEAKEAAKSPLVTGVFKGCFRKFGSIVKRASPMEIYELERVVKSSNTFDEQLFAMMLCVAFSGLHRIGELTLPNSLEDQVFSNMILRSDIEMSDCRTYVKYRLPWNKTDLQRRGTEVTFFTREGPSDPIALIQRYNKRRDSFSLDPYWLILENGSYPTRAWFVTRLNSYFGMSRTGHSLRVGGATALYSAGMTRDDIRVIGRWNTLAAIDLYIRENPMIIKGAHARYMKAMKSLPTKGTVWKKI